MKFQEVETNPTKIEAVKNFPLPKTLTEIKAFLGLLGYYRKFIKDLVRLTNPLALCLKKGVALKIEKITFKRSIPVKIYQ